MLPPLIDSHLTRITTSIVARSLAAPLAVADAVRPLLAPYQVPLSSLTAILPVRPRRPI
jgi:hypothetical protein